jgi:hypothetical protein
MFKAAAAKYQEGKCQNADQRENMNCAGPARSTVTSYSVFPERRKMNGLILRRANGPRPSIGLRMLEDYSPRRASQNAERHCGAYRLP